MQRIARSFLSKRAGDSIPYTMAPKRPFPNGNASVHTCAGRSYQSLYSCTAKLPYRRYVEERLHKFEIQKQRALSVYS